MASWPVTLPAPEGPGYAINPVAPTIRTDMEGGSARVRRRTSARNDVVKLAWMMTDAQIAIFRAWFDDASTGAAGGSAWFTVSLAIGTGDYASVTARFKGVYAIAYVNATTWSVSAELEIR